MSITVDSKSRSPEEQLRRSKRLAGLFELKGAVRNLWWELNRRTGRGSVSRKERWALLRQGIDSRDPDFARFYKAGLLAPVDHEAVAAAHAYQRQMLGRTLDAGLHVAYANLHGECEVRLLPHGFYWHELLPRCNDQAFRGAYSDKNLYSLLAHGLKQPRTRFRCVAGNGFDEDLHPVQPTTPLNDVLGSCGTLIIKPARTDNGEDVALLRLSTEGGMIDGSLFKTVGAIGERYGENYLIQERVAQHSVLAEPHPDSVNTLRILTLRWGGECHFLLGFARFGAYGAVKDNAGTGGICVGVDDAGRLQDFAITERAERISRHPSTGYDFASRPQVPGFADAVRLCVDGHRSVLHHNLVSWDIAIDRGGAPTFIEYNFRGALWLYQLATKRALLGEFTDEVLRWIASFPRSNVPRTRGL